MTREQKIAKARELRDNGALYKEIAEQLDVSITTACEYVTGCVTAWKKAHPDRVREQNLRRNDAKRRHAREQASDCEQCGKRLGGRGHKLCSDCERAQREAQAQERTERFIQLRRDGLNNHEIAEHEDCAFYVVAVVLNRAGRYGLEVPRSPYWNRKKAAA